MLEHGASHPNPQTCGDDSVEVDGVLRFPTRQVGQTSLFVPALSLGCSPLGELWDEVSPEDALAAIKEAHRVGYSHFDTAPWYGNGMSEARVGMALNTVAQKGGAFTVSTKVGRFLDPKSRGTDGPWDGPWHGGYNLRVRVDYSYDAVMQQFRESCLRMGLPNVAALTIHDLDAMFGGDDVVEKYLEQLSANGGMCALRQLKELGDIKAIGIGCNPYKFGSREVCLRVADMGGLDFILLAGPYNLLNQEALDDLLPLCREKGMSAFVGAPFASGILAVGSRVAQRPNYMYEPASDDMLAKVARIEELCDKYKVPLPAAALQFPLFHPRVACVLSGVKSSVEVHRAREAFLTHIPDAFWKELRSQGLIRQDAPIVGDSIDHL